ncbi:MAG: response regulator transcription factor [Hyphomonas sp.]|uniref:response regulator n=1 Tax=Hyphomonas sp. TaxID=87 RepID=UPI00352830FE
MSEVPTILIVDDHPLFRDALEVALNAAFPDGAVAHHAGSLADALGKVGQSAYDLILLDLTLADSQEFDGLSRLLAAGPGCPVVVVSATESSRAFDTARALGAAGYLPKSMSLEDLSAALATALDGGQWFPPRNDADTAGRDELLARVAGLTPAQRKVLSGLADGLLNKQIAYEMDISVATVKAHMTAIFRKLGANNRTQALLIYKEATSL